MRYPIIVLVILLNFPAYCQKENLIINSGLEDLNSFYNPSSNHVSLEATPDIFRINSDESIDKINSINKNVHPKSGSCFAGLVVKSAENYFPINNREYISFELKKPLKIGAEYELSFWLTTGKNGEMEFLADQLGILFSVDSTIQNSTNVLGNNPQLKIKIKDLSSLIDWVQFTIIYIPKQERLLKK